MEPKTGGPPKGDISSNLFRALQEKKQSLLKETRLPGPPCEVAMTPFEPVKWYPRSGGFPGKCEKFEKELRGAAKARGPRLRFRRRSDLFWGWRHGHAKRCLADVFAKQSIRIQTHSLTRKYALKKKVSKQPLSVHTGVVRPLVSGPIAWHTRSLRSARQQELRAARMRPLLEAQWVGADVLKQFCPPALASLGISQTHDIFFPNTYGVRTPTRLDGFGAGHIGKFRGWLLAHSFGYAWISGRSPSIRVPCFSLLGRRVSRWTPFMKLGMGIHLFPHSRLTQNGCNLWVFGSSKNGNLGYPATGGFSFGHTLETAGATYPIFPVAPMFVSLFSRNGSEFGKPRNPPPNLNSDPPKKKQKRDTPPKKNKKKTKTDTPKFNDTPPPSPKKAWTQRSDTQSQSTGVEPSPL